MKVILATGIYPPEIGGPATYVRALAEAMVGKGIEVSVITYGEVREYGSKEVQKWPVMYVAKSLPIIRWLKYASALKQHAADADAVIAFSSIYAGVPLLLSPL